MHFARSSKRFGHIWTAFSGLEALPEGVGRVGELRGVHLRGLLAILQHASHEEVMRVAGDAPRLSVGL